MKTQTSKQTLWLRSLLVLPLLAILIFSFSTKKQVEKEIQSQSEIKTDIPKLVILENPLQLLLNGELTNLENLKDDFTKITKGEASDLIIDLTNTEEIKYSFVTKIKNTLKGKIKTIHLNGAYYSVDKKSNQISIIKKTQENATPEQIAEYNKLASYYNKGLRKKESIQILLKDKTRLEYIYSLMSDAQKQKTEPHPNFPPIPPSPIVKKGEISNIPPPPKAPKVKKGKVSNIPPPPPPIPGNATKEQRAKYEKVHEEYNEKYSVKNGGIYENMIPPPPRSPLDHVIHMAKENATFYFDGKKITSDQAIKILKKNDEINISTKTNNGLSTVNLSTKPIEIKD